MFRRLTNLLLAAFVTASAVAQVGCGVVHCIEPHASTAVTEPEPTCHGAASTADGDPAPAHENGEGHGACCISQPAEKPDATSMATIDVQVLAFDVVALQLPLNIRPLGPPTFRETGPPGWSTGAAPLPLRV